VRKGERVGRGRVRTTIYTILPSCTSHVGQTAGYCEGEDKSYTASEELKCSIKAALVSTYSTLKASKSIANTTR
jgi:hypothetical protein